MTETGWQPIETAPKDGARILAWCEGWSSPQTVQFYGAIGWAQDYDLGPFKDQPTHWMVIPTPPSQSAIPGEFEIWDGKICKVAQPEKTGYWRFHEYPPNPYLTKEKQQ